EKAAVVVAPGDGPRVLTREGPEQPWHLTSNNDPLAAGTQIVGGLGATIDSANGAVRTQLISDLCRCSPFPILETSLVLQDAKDADLAFIMDRGRVDLINHKKAGAAKVKVTVRDKTGEITLPEPGDR